MSVSGVTLVYLKKAFLFMRYVRHLLSQVNQRNCYRITEGIYNLRQYTYFMAVTSVTPVTRELCVSSIPH